MSKPFRFKRFTVIQERAAMKVGTDGVLLGAWCTVGADIRRALDIGTGTGLIAIMLAQRGELTGLVADALEPEEGAFADAAGNAAASTWNDRINVFNKTLQEYSECPHSGPYDLIVCNPPYFTSSLLPEGKARTAARHDVLLGRDELTECAAKLSRTGSLLAVIIPSEQAAQYVTSAANKGFSLIRCMDVHPTPASVPRRTLLEFRYGEQEPGFEPRFDKLVIETSPLCYTGEYRTLTKEFYIKF